MKAANQDSFISQDLKTAISPIAGSEDVTVAKLQEQFVYPTNKKLKEAYIAILGMMKLERKINFSVYSCACAIAEHNGWVMDYDPEMPSKGKGPRYKRTLQLIKALENPFFKLNAPGYIELCVYDVKTRTRITRFDDFFKMCVKDTHMSEFTGCDVEVQYSEWEDVKALPDNQITGIDTSILAAEPLVEDPLESSMESPQYGTHESNLFKRLARKNRGVTPQ